MTFHPTYREILIKNDTGCKLRILIKQKKAGIESSAG